MALRCVIPALAAHLVCGCHVLLPLSTPTGQRDAAAAERPGAPDTFVSEGPVDAPWEAEEPDGLTDGPTGDGPPAPVCTLYVNDSLDGDDILTSGPGDDANPGTAAAPLASLLKAVTLANPGETICLDAGTYLGNTSGVVPLTKALTIAGRRWGEPACGRTGPESVVKARIEVSSAASQVTLGGLQLERSPTGVGWKGVNLGFDAPTFVLHSTRVVPGAAVSSMRPGYVATTLGAALSSIQIRDNSFATLRNTTGTGSIWISASVSGDTEITGNCFDTSGDTFTVLLTGSFKEIRFGANIVTNDPLDGAGGLVLYKAVADTVLVENNVIRDAPENGLWITESTIGSALTVAGNVIRGSGRKAQVCTVSPEGKCANIKLAANTTLPKALSVQQNDLAAPGSGLSMINATGNTLAAPCNWYGSPDPAVAAGMVQGVTVPSLLTNNTDQEPAKPGFQPDTAACVPTP